MYERLVWTLPKGFRKPIKAVAGLALRSLSCVLRFSPSNKRRLSQALRFRFRTAIVALDAVPADRLDRCVLFLSLKPHTREAKLAEAARFAGWHPILISTESPNFDADKYFEWHARVSGLFQLVLVSWLFRGP